MSASPNTFVLRPTVLKAAYRAPPPSNPSSLSESQEPETRDFQRQIALSPDQTSETNGTVAKSAYLSELRSQVASLQDEINVFLTEKMEQDKALAEQANGAATAAMDEGEEENYGEEVVADDDQ